MPEIHASSSRPGGVRGRGDVARVRDGSSRDARTHPENSLVFAPICTCSSSPTTVSHSSSSPGRSEEDVVVEKKRGRRPSRDDDDDDAWGGGIEPLGSDSRVEMIAASLDRDASARRSIRDASRHDRAISGALRTGAPHWAPPGFFGSGREKSANCDTFPSQPITCAQLDPFPLPLFFSENSNCHEEFKFRPSDAGQP